ncbi:hypothetical protein VKT23_009031 [Stygiomarasmius scandens]|uniref:Uncharacterized protein n=1 Tax=Marasmiellus scandens TaxID=2682957 RepID=A0ABR1JG86_9AGAR
MGDAAGDAGAACCGLCCVGIFGALSSYCSTVSLGAIGCGGKSGTGCCGSCCKESFDADNFDEVVKKDMEKTRAKDSASKDEQTQQPQPTPDMNMAAVK